MAPRWSNNAKLVIKTSVIPIYGEGSMMNSEFHRGHGSEKIRFSGCVGCVFPEVPCDKRSHP